MDGDTGFDWATGIALVGLFVSVFSAIKTAGAATDTIREGNKARDLATVEGIRASVRETSIDLFKALNDKSADAAHDFYACHYLDAVEFAAHVHQDKMMGAESHKFIEDWLKTELNSLADQAWLVHHLKAKKLNDGDYSQARAFARQFGIKLF